MESSEFINWGVVKNETKKKPGSTYKKKGHARAPTAAAPDEGEKRPTPLLPPILHALNAVNSRPV
jgi:hypothetical protein